MLDANNVISKVAFPSGPGGAEELVVGLYGITSPTITIQLWPGAVYQTQLSRHPGLNGVEFGMYDVMGLTPEPASDQQEVDNNLPNDGIIVKPGQKPSAPWPAECGVANENAIIEDAMFGGQVSQITPFHTLRFVYAVLTPLVVPGFSDEVQFTRAENDLTVPISDVAYNLDNATTSLVTYTAEWTDPVDNPNDPSNNPAKDTSKIKQGSLVVTVSDPFAAPVAADPMIGALPEPVGSDVLPFGSG